MSPSVDLMDPRKEKKDLNHLVKQRDRDGKDVQQVQVINK